MPSHTNLPTRLAVTFLKALDPTAPKFTFQAFEDRANKTGNPPARVIHSWRELLHEHALGAGAYVTINETDLAGRKAENIKRIRAVWQEDDDGFAGTFPLEPSLVAESSPGHFHRYWLTADDWPADEQGRKDFDGVMQCMVENYGSDKNAKDICRVLRLPGFLHRKNGTPHLVRVIANSGKRYTRAEIIAAFPAPVRKEKPASSSYQWHPQHDDDEQIRDAIFAINADDRLVWRDIGMALKDHYSDPGRALWDQWSRTSKKYDDKEQDKAWRSFRRQGITIATLFHHAKQAGWESKSKKESKVSSAKVIELAKLRPLDFGKIRKDEAKKLGVPVKFLDDAVKEQQKEKKNQANFLPHWNNEPWPERVDGDALLTELRAHLKRHVVLPPHADVALPLWILHTWVFEAFDITPYLAITSPTRRCGKTLLMTLLYWLCQRAKKNDSMSKAAIYRSVDRDKPTLVLDEVGWVVDQRDERQNILCGGFERNGYAETCEGEGADITTKLWSTFCPKAFGLIGKLTATLMDRSIEIPMRRKLAEKVERLRRWDNEEHAGLRRLCCRWVQDNIEALTKATPALPDKLNDRAADFWEPLLAVAAQAGGDWPKLAAEAAIALSGGDSAGNEEKGVELLADIKTAFAAAGVAAFTTKTLLADHLCADTERPWATYNKGKPISDRQLAKLLRPFAIISETVHPYETGEAQDLKGYKREHFGDAFGRYLTPAKGGQNNVSSGNGGSQASYRPNADGAGITSDFSIRPESEKDGNEKCEKPANHGEKDTRTDKKSETLREEVFGSNGGNGADTADAYAELADRGEPPGMMAANGFAISATPEDRKPPEPGQLTARVWIKEIRPPALGPPGDDLNDFAISGGPRWR
jgi:hypothetical protein